MILDYFWLFATGGGAALLGCALLYGSTRSRRLTPTERSMRDDKVRELYDKDDHAA
jgi:formate hydrogenlyase subunit 3/multisubunit Na+/H+ antiporter MnhD subunit